MRIQIKMEGGLFFSNLNKPVTIEVDKLPAQEAAELRQLLKTAQVSKLPKPAGKPSPQAADMQQYKITIEDKGKRHAVDLNDKLDDPDLRKLLNFLKAKAAELRAAGKQN